VKMVSAKDSRMKRLRVKESMTETKSPKAKESMMETKSSKVKESMMQTKRLKVKEMEMESLKVKESMMETAPKPIELEHHPIFLPCTETLKMGFPQHKQLAKRKTWPQLGLPPFPPSSSSLCCSLLLSVEMKKEKCLLCLLRTHKRECLLEGK